MNTSRIPEELKQDPSWVLWKYVERDGKPTKEPHQANVRRAKSNAPATWTTFDKAVEAFERGGFDGIGFVFHDGNPYAGADIDDVTEEQAREWVDRFDSYAERSPSGNGLHIIVKAELPEGTNRRGRGELYSSGRFFTMTGDTVRSRPVREAQAEAEKYYSYLRKNDRRAPERATSFDSPDLEDADVLRLLENARNGHEFAAIYAGLGEFPSGSERDLSLANRISFYTQNEEQVERIMRGSGCIREKWDKHRTYLRDTIRKAISGLTNTYTPAGVTNITTKRESKKSELQTGIRDLTRRWWDFDWARVKGTEEKPHWMRGYTCRDVMIVLINEAAQHGKVVGETIEVGIGRRKLALKAATSLRTVHKSVRHLEKENWLEFRPPKDDGNPGVYILRATLHHVLSISTEAGELEGKRGGGEDLRGPRLRWSAPYVPRLGKHNGAIVEHVLDSGGDMQIEELAEALGKRARDLRRRNLPKLEKAGIIEVDGSLVRLAADWRENLEKKRREDGEIEAEERDRKKYAEQSENYRNRDKTPADKEPPLIGREKMAEILKARAKDDEEQRIEHQRQKVGATAETFVYDKLQTEALLVAGGIRLGLLRGVYADAGGNPADVLAAAVRLGCKVERRPEFGNEQFVLPPERNAA